MSANVTKRKLRTIQIFDRYGPQPGDFAEASEAFARTAYTVLCQMAVAHAVIGCVNASVLRAIRRLPSPTLQEKIASSLLIPLAIGDVMHQLGTFYGMGDVRWKMNEWPEILWLNIIFGILLFVPRYVDVERPRVEVADLTTGFAGSWASVDTSQLATAG